MVAGASLFPNSPRVHALRAYYFTSFVALGAILPLVALVLSARGFAPHQYAWLMVLMPLSRTFAPPLWGAIADNFTGTRRLLTFNSALAAVAMLAFAFTERTGPSVLVFAVWALCTSALAPLADASAYQLLATRGAKYGFLRVWGSIGFLLSATGVGLFAVDDAVRTPLLIASAGYLAAAIASRALPSARSTGRSNFFASLSAMAGRREAWLLWLGGAFHYFAHGIYDIYLGPHVTANAGVTKGQVSLAWAASVVVEIPMILAMPKLLERVPHHRLLMLASGASVLRWLLMAHVSSPLGVFALQPLHALTFAVWYLAYVHAAQAIAPDHLRATAQGLASTFMGSGMALSAVTGGYVLEAFGGTRLFELAALAASGAFVFYALLGRLETAPLLAPTRSAPYTDE